MNDLFPQFRFFNRRQKMKLIFDHFIFEDRHRNLFIPFSNLIWVNKLTPILTYISGGDANNYYK